MTPVKLIIALLTLVLCTKLSAADITGFWNSIDKNTKKPNAMIAIYQYEGKYYGRIIGSYNKKGEIDDSIYNPQSRAPGIKGKPYYSGLDIVWNAKPQGRSGKYKGYVVNPKSGSTYRAELWKRKESLVLRGEFLMFGKNVIWQAAPEDTFNDTFKKPDVSTFVPVIPKAIH